MKSIITFLCALALPSICLAGPYQGLTISTGPGTAVENVSGYIGVAASSKTPTSYNIYLNGVTGEITGLYLYGNGAGITGVTAGSVAAGNVTPGTFVQGVVIRQDGVNLSTVTTAFNLVASSTASLQAQLISVGVSTMATAVATTTFASQIAALNTSTITLSNRFVNNTSSMTNSSSQGILVVSSITTQGSFFGDGSRLTGLQSGTTNWILSGTVVQLATATNNVVIQSSLTVQGSTFSVGGAKFSVTAGTMSVSGSVTILSSSTTNFALTISSGINFTKIRTGIVWADNTVSTSARIPATNIESGPLGARVLVSSLTAVLAQAAGTFGNSATAIQQTVNKQGQITSIANVAIQISESQVTSLSGDLNNRVQKTGDTMGGALTLNGGLVSNGYINLNVGTKLGTSTAGVQNVIIARGGFQSCSGTPTHNNCHFYDGDQGSCETNNNHGGCSWAPNTCTGTPANACSNWTDENSCSGGGSNNAHGGCSSVNSCQGSLDWGSDCHTYDGDETSCNNNSVYGCGYSGYRQCNGTPSTEDCHTWDGDQSSCEANTNHGSQCSWDGALCNGGPITCGAMPSEGICSGESGCSPDYYCNGTAACSNSGEGTCTNQSSCFVGFDHCIGTPSCGGVSSCNDETGCGFSDLCNGSATCQNNETYCGAEGGCTINYGGAMNLHLPECLANQGRNYWIKKDFVGNNVTVKPYTYQYCGGAVVAACSDYTGTNQSDCEVHLGCTWNNPNCEGTITPCVSRTEAQCVDEPTCEWQIVQQKIEGKDNYAITKTSQAVQITCNQSSWTVVGDAVATVDISGIAAGSDVTGTFPTALLVTHTQAGSVSFSTVAAAIANEAAARAAQDVLIAADTTTLHTENISVSRINLSTVTSAINAESATRAAQDVLIAAATTTIHTENVSISRLDMSTFVIVTDALRVQLNSVGVSTLSIAAATTTLHTENIASGRLSGIVASSVLPSTVAYTSIANTFSAAQSITTISSSETVQGNAFSVGGSSFTITGGSGTVAYSMRAGSFIGVSGATETVTAALTGVGTVANPLGVDSSSVTVKSSGLIRNSEIDKSSITAQGQTFNGNSQLVKTDSSGRLPGIDGSQLTNLPSSGESQTYTSSKTITGAGGLLVTGTGGITANGGNYILGTATHTLMASSITNNYIGGVFVGTTSVHITTAVVTTGGGISRLTLVGDNGAEFSVIGTSATNLAATQGRISAISISPNAAITGRGPRILLYRSSGTTETQDAIVGSGFDKGDIIWPFYKNSNNTNNDGSAITVITEGPQDATHENEQMHLRTINGATQNSVIVLSSSKTVLLGNVGVTASIPTVVAPAGALEIAVPSTESNAIVISSANRTSIATWDKNGSIVSPSSITAGSFFGDGTNITGVPANESQTYTSSKTITGAGGLLVSNGITGSSLTLNSTGITGLQGAPFTINTAGGGNYGGAGGVVVSSNGAIIIGSTQVPSATTRMVIGDADGNSINTAAVVIFTTATYGGTNFGQNRLIWQPSTTQDVFRIDRFGPVANNDNIMIFRRSSGTIASPVTPPTGWRLGEIKSSVQDETQTERTVTQIIMTVDGASATTHIPGMFQFFTDNNTALAERARLTSTGTWSINNTAPTARRLDIAETDLDGSTVAIISGNNTNENSNTNTTLYVRARISATSSEQNVIVIEDRGINNNVSGAQNYLLQLRGGNNNKLAKSAFTRTGSAGFGTITPQAGVHISSAPSFVDGGPGNDVSLLIDGNSATPFQVGTSTFIIDGSNGRVGIMTTAPSTALAVTGYITSSSTIPSIACNAGTPTIESSSTNQAGTFVSGTAAANCTITFSTSWPKTPHCVVTDDSSLVAIRVSARSTTAITIAGTTISGDTISYFCWGAP